MGLKSAVQIQTLISFHLPLKENVAPALLLGIKPLIPASYRSSEAQGTF